MNQAPSLELLYSSIAFVILVFKAYNSSLNSFAIVELGKDSVWKLPRVKNYKVPEKEAGCFWRNY